MKSAARFLLLGGLLLAALVLLGFGGLVFLDESNDASDAEHGTCGRNVSAIRHALAHHLDRHDGRLPDAKGGAFLDALLADWKGTSRACPRLDAPYRVRDNAPGSPHRIEPPWTSDEAHEIPILACPGPHRLLFHPDGFWVLYLDGSIRQVEAGEEPESLDALVE